MLLRIEEWWQCQLQPLGDLSWNRFAALPPIRRTVAWTGVVLLAGFAVSLAIGMLLVPWGLELSPLLEYPMTFFILAPILIGPLCHLIVHHPFGPDPYVRHYLKLERALAKALWTLGLLAYACQVAMYVLIATHGPDSYEVLYWISIVGLTAYFYFYYKAPQSAEELRELTRFSSKWINYSAGSIAFLGLAATISMLGYVGELSGADSALSDGLAIGCFLGAICTLAGPWAFPPPVPLQVIWPKRFWPTIFTYCVWMFSITGWALLFGWPIEKAEMTTSEDWPLLLAGLLYIALTATCTMLAVLKERKTITQGQA